MLFAALLNSLQPFNWITDPTIISTIIGIVAGAVIGFVITYWFYRKGKNWHLIVYEVISDTPIVSVKEKTGRGKIEVIYESGQGHIDKINDASLLTLKLWNEGNGDVKIWKAGDKDVTDLEEPIQFEFEGRTVVDLTNVKTGSMSLLREPSSKVIGQQASNKVIGQQDLSSYLSSPSPSPTSLCLPRCILKQGEFLQLSILLNGPSGNVKLKEGKLFNGEVVNIKEIERRTKARNWLIRVILVLLVIGIPLLLYKLYTPSSSEIIVGIVIFVLVWMLLGAVAPFRCAHRYCGYRTWNPWNMRKHVEGKHSVE